jgi:hypothetical protein
LAQLTLTRHKRLTKGGCAVTNDSYSDEVDVDTFTEVLTGVLPAFKKLNQEGRERLLRTIATIFGIKGALSSSGGQAFTQSGPNYSTSEVTGSFSQDRSMTPKEFLMQKQPRTDVERVACLGYYLTHYRDTPHFKTLDISKINTEAAQPKFANAANAVDNATKNGYLVPATKGNKQLSAASEQFVQALPDRDAAKAVMSNARPRRKARKQTQKKSTES